MGFASKIVLLGGLASTAVAHGVVSSFTTDGEFHEGWQNQYLKAELAGKPIPEMAAWHSQNLDMGFVSTQHYQTPDIICHKSATAPNTTATVSAGGTVEFKWNQWVDSHMGPVFTYVANCGGDCEKVDKEALKWVKIDEGGKNEETGEWAAVTMISNDATWVTKVPEELVAGSYVFRHEIIAIYGKQHYPQCMSIEITGDGTESPEGVIGTELYRIENQKGGGTETDYLPPGPPKWIPGSDSSDDSTIPSPLESAASSGTAVATTAPAVSSETAAATEAASPTETAVTSDAAVSSSVASETSAEPEATPTKKSCYDKRRHARHLHA